MVIPHPRFDLSSDTTYPSSLPSPVPSSGPQPLGRESSREGTHGTVTTQTHKRSGPYGDAEVSSEDPSPSSRRSCRKQQDI